MNPNELTPTQRVESEASDGWTGDAVCVSKSFALELAAELERVKKDLDDACAVIACKDIDKAALRNERDDLNRKVEELKREVLRNNETAQTWDRLSLEAALAFCRDALIALDITARSICGTVEERKNAHKAIELADSVLKGNK